MPTKRIDPVQRIVEMYTAMSPFDRGRVAYAMAAIEPASQKPEPKPKRKAAKAAEVAQA